MRRKLGPIVICAAVLVALSAVAVNARETAKDAPSLTTLSAVGGRASDPQTRSLSDGTVSAGERQKAHGAMLACIRAEGLEVISFELGELGDSLALSGSASDENQAVVDRCRRTHFDLVNQTYTDEHGDPAALKAHLQDCLTTKKVGIDGSTGEPITDGDKIAYADCVRDSVER